MGPDASLTLTRRQANTSEYYSVEGTRVHTNQCKSNDKRASHSISKRNYLTSQGSDKSKKPKLNDYLSFSPRDTEVINKFFNRRKTEADTERI
jgi:hypothetical protein